MQAKTAAFLLGTVAIVALAGCASKPQISAQQESGRYLSRAGRSYSPPGSSSDPWGPYIQEASAKYDVPEKWIREVMRQESGGRLYGRGGEPITSGAGAMGLMQVMPATYDDLRSRYRELGEDPYDPHNNILAGSAYLREMYDIYGAPGFLAAYNAGPGRLDDYLTRNRTLPAETRRYVASIGPRISGYEPSRPSPGAMYAMNSMPLDIPAGPRYPDAASQFASAAPMPGNGRPIVLNPPMASATVEVAEAAPQSYIKLKPAAAEPVVVAEAMPAQPYIKLNPPAPMQVADAEPERAPIQLNPPMPLPPPQPSVLAAAGSSQRYAQLAPPQPEEEYRASAGSRSWTQTARAVEMPIPEPPPLPPSSQRWTQFARRSAPSGPRPIEVAELPEPPRMPARLAAAAELVPLGPRQHGFSLIPTANAAPIHHGAPIATSGSWAVQVGAFANQNLAHSATAAAREHARDVLGGAQTVVAGVRQPGGTLYRARLGGLSHEAAAQACERLSRARTNCMVVSPDAQR